MSQIIFDLERFNTFIPSKYSSFSKEEKEEFWNSLSTRLKEQLEHIESFQDSDPLDFLIKNRLETQVQNIKSSSVPVHSKSPQTPLKKLVPIFPIHIPSSGIITYPLPSQQMATRFAPLALPAQLHDLPQNYAQRIKSCGNEGDVTTQQHVDRFMDFIDLEEVDHEDAIMRLFSQSFIGEVKKWFKTLVIGSIHDFQQF